MADGTRVGPTAGPLCSVPTTCATPPAHKRRATTKAHGPPRTMCGTINGTLLRMFNQDRPGAESQMLKPTQKHPASMHRSTPFQSLVSPFMPNIPEEPSARAPRPPLNKFHPNGLALSSGDASRHHARRPHVAGRRHPAALPPTASAGPPLAAACHRDPLCAADRRPSPRRARPTPMPSQHTVRRMPLSDVRAHAMMATAHTSAPQRLRNCPPLLKIRRDRLGRTCWTFLAQTPRSSKREHERSSRPADFDRSRSSRVAIRATLALPILGD